MHVIGWQSLKCKGQTMNWLVAVPALVAVRQTQSHDLQFSNWLTPTTSDHPTGAADRPALPPPKFA
jgi:hypothetical protein